MRRSGTVPVRKVRWGIIEGRLAVGKPHAVRPGGHSGQPAYRAAALKLQQSESGFLEVRMTCHGVCPWWVDLLTTPLRRLMQDPAAIVAPYVHDGMTVLEPGPGMGFFTLELARRVGPSGHVIAVDIQPRMIAGLRRRAQRAGLLDRINARLVPPTSMELHDFHEAVDFVFAFAVVHEMPAPDPFFSEAARASKPGATLLLAEPAGHVDEAEFTEELAAAARNGLAVAGDLSLRGCRAALLRKPAL